MRGYRATRAEWDAHRQPRSEYKAGAVYGPDVRPGQAKYSTVTWDGDQASAFTLNFPDGTSREQAQAEAMAELPDGAFVQETRNDPEGWVEGIGGTSLLSPGFWPYVVYRFNAGDLTVRWAAFGTYSEGQLPPP